MPKSNKLLSIDHSHSHSNLLFLLVVFINFHVIFLFFFFWSKNTPRDGQKHPQVASWEPLGSFLAPLGVLFDTPGGPNTPTCTCTAFWYPFWTVLAPQKPPKTTHVGTHFRSKIHPKTMSNNDTQKI